MRFDKLSYQSTRRSAAGFTLVEMLIVIVIIAIVAAILFPVYKKVLESSRQSTSISNLKQIGQALVKYQQDHDGHSPSVLFGYSVSGASMQNAYSTAAAAAATASTSVTAFPGLYPAYIKDYNVFTDPDNQASPTDSSASNAVADGVNSLNSDGSVNTAGTASFYIADAYDHSPEVTSSGGLSPTQDDAWYETTWTNAAQLPLPPQLMTPNPNGAAFVTATTYHVDKNGNVLALFEDGTVRIINWHAFYPNQTTPYLLKPGG